MGLTDEELKVRMMVEAEAAIDNLLAQKRPFEEITLTEGEQQVPGPACSECGQAMHYKGVKEKRIISETGAERMLVIRSAVLSSQFDQLWLAA